MTTATPTATERNAELTERVKARRLNKRQLVAAVARAEYLLEVRTAGASRLVQHNAQLEAELRSVVAADAVIVTEVELGLGLVHDLQALGDEYGQLGVIRAALTVLGGRK